MGAISKSFHRFGTQSWHFVGLPIFFFAVTMIYHPFDIREFLDMGGGRLEFNLTIITAIFFGVLLGSRLLFFLSRKSRRIGLPLYAAWCVIEVFIACAFSALFICLMYRGELSYFWCLGKLFSYSFAILIFPYAIMTLLLMLHDAKSGNAPADEDLIRFRDTGGRLKLTIAPKAVLYVESKENYVLICYQDGTRVRNYLLRGSMKRTEELLTRHGMVRCHRTCIVNPTHINILRRDKEWMIYADLDVEGCPSIPVSKPNYDKLSALL